MLAVPIIIVFDLGAVFTGIAGRSLFPGLADPETILPVMTGGLLPEVFTGVFLVIVLAASMSTVDSLLILVSSSVARDVVQNVLRPSWSDARVRLLGQITTVVVGVAAVLFALQQVRLIFWFVLFAWSGLACAFTPPVLCSLFWSRTTRAGAIAGMIAGFLTAVLWVVAFKSRFLDLYEMIPGFVAGFAATIVVSLLTKAPPGAAEEMAAVRMQVRGGAADVRPPRTS
jgi:sodium/proline symporter